MQAGHRRACFEEEAMPHVRALLRTAVRLCRRQEAAEDLVQETMLRAWKAFDRYQPQTNCKAWLFAILMNLWNEEHRKPWARHESPSGEEFEPDQQTVASNSDNRVFIHEVLACVDRLPEEQRCVLLLSVVEGLALREVAAMLNIPIGTVMSRLGRARAALREFMRPNPAVMPSAREQKLCDAMKPKGC
jgi:RNA polymerase sigma-70 factor (ECF subfamily)